jgi:hypothetical protein
VTSSVWSSTARSPDIVCAAGCGAASGPFAPSGSCVLTWSKPAIWAKKLAFCWPLGE